MNNVNEKLLKDLKDAALVIDTVMSEDDTNFIYETIKESIKDIESPGGCYCMCGECIGF